MDQLLCGHQTKAAKLKQPKNIKKKPVKVLYISNPMKVKTTASGFRALVQQLTGRNSDYACFSPVISSHETVTVDGGAQEDNNHDHDHDHDHGTEVLPKTLDMEPPASSSEVTQTSDSTLEPWGDVFMPADQMLENFTCGLLQSRFLF